MIQVMQMTGGGWGSVTGLQQAMCGEPAAKQKRAPVSNAQSRTLVPLCVVRSSVRGWCCSCAVRCARRAAPSLARSLVLAGGCCSGETDSGGFKHSLSLFLHPHPLYEGLFNFG